MGQPNADRQAALAEIVALTRGMLEQAQAQTWERVARLDAERRQRLQAFFAVEISEEDREWIGRGMQEIIELNSAIVDLGRGSLGNLFEKISSLQAGRRASRAYAGGERG